jgi:hypothetical protein
MALGQKYSFSYHGGKSFIYFWAKNDNEAISRIKRMKLILSKDTALTNCSLKKEVELTDEN